VANLTPNQQELAGVIDDRCDSATDEDLIALCERLRDPDNTDEQIAAALEAINPEETLAASAIAVRVAALQQNNISQRIRSVRTGTAQPGVDVSRLTLQSGDSTISGAALSEMLQVLTGGAAGDSDFGRWGFFVDGNVNFGDKDRSRSDAGYKYDGVGVTAGGDYRLRDDLILGAAFGYSMSDVGFRGAGGSLDVESWNVTLFGSWFNADSYYVDAQVSYGQSDYDSQRRVRFEDASGLFDRNARGTTDGSQMSAAFGAGYDFNRGALTFGPHLGANFLDAEVKALRENGAGSLNMQVGQQDTRSLTASAGGHMSYAYNTSWGVLLPHLRFDWTREFETSVNRVRVNFADDPVSTYLLRGDRIDPSYFLWSAGVSAQFIRGISGFVNFQQMLGFENLEFSQVNYGLRYERAF
jgi:outer membrane autotransporter protein